MLFSLIRKVYFPLLPDHLYIFLITDKFHLFLILILSCLYMSKIWKVVMDFSSKLNPFRNIYLNHKQKVF